jgi:hypothetical protein
MACLSPTATEIRLDDRAASVVWRALRNWRSAWRRSCEQWQDQRAVASLDDRSLRDLGLQRGAIEPRAPRDLGPLWLSRPAL